MSDAMMAAIAALQLNNDERVAAARAAAIELRDKQLLLKDLKDLLAQTNREINQLQFSTLPALLDTLGVDRIGLPASGNWPAFDLMLSPWVKAVIPADWPPDRRAAAFAELIAFGQEDLIKTEIATSLPRGSHELAATIANAIASAGAVPHVAETVHHGTLTAWLTTLLEAGEPLPDLPTIGGTISRIARIKER